LPLLIDPVGPALLACGCFREDGMPSPVQTACPFER